MFQVFESVGKITAKDSYNIIYTSVVNIQIQMSFQSLVHDSFVPMMIQTKKDFQIDAC